MSFKAAVVSAQYEAKIYHRSLILLPYRQTIYFASALEFGDWERLVFDHKVADLQNYP